MPAGSKEAAPSSTTTASVSSMTRASFDVTGTPVHVRAGGALEPVKKLVTDGRHVGRQRASRQLRMVKVSSRNEDAERVA